MDISSKQLKGKPKKVGELDGEPVLQAETKGGLFVLVGKGGKTLGAGAHPAVAAHIAERDFPKLKLTELSKSESLDLQTVRQELPASLRITRALQAAEK